MKSAPKQLVQKPVKLPSKKSILIVLATVLLLLTGLFLYLRHQSQASEERAFQADKARFARVERDMDLVYAAIKRKLGTPKHESNSKDCSRVSFKFKGGQLGCNITYDFVYGSADYDSAREMLAKSYNVVLENSSFKPIKNGDDDLRQKADPIGYQQERDLEIIFSSRDAASCSLRLNTDKPGVGNEYPNMGGDRVAILSFNCYEDVQKAIYTLAE